MKHYNTIRLLLTLVCLLTLFNGTSLAALQAVGPTDIVTTLPTWYMDTNGLPLAPCIDQNGLCILPPPFDADPVTDPIGTVASGIFPDEAFYYSAFAANEAGNPALKFTIEGGEVVVFGYVLEFAFLSGVVPDTAITFLRTDLQKMRNLTANATYRVTHPYGTFEFQTDASGVTIDAGPGIRFEDQPGSIANYLPPLFKAAPNTNIGPFLIPVGGSASFVTDPLDSSKVYIGDPLLPVQVTGSPTNNNFVRIERLDASGLTVDSWQTDYFTLMGRVFTDQIPSPMAIDSSPYASDAVTGQVDVFVTALPTAVPTISGTGIPTTVLTQDTPNTGKFFAHLPLGSTIPADLIIENSLDAPPIPYPVQPVDEVNITQAIYDPTTKFLTVKAVSRDTISPPVTLTVPAFAVVGDPASNTLDSTGTLAIDLSSTIPPLTVQVVSSQGGTSTAKVSVVDSAAAPASSTAILRH